MYTQGSWICRWKHIKSEQNLAQKKNSWSHRKGTRAPQGYEFLKLVKQWKHMRSMKKGVPPGKLFTDYIGYRGFLHPTQLRGDDFINHEIRIPSLNNLYFMEVSGRFLFRASHVFVCFANHFFVVKSLLLFYFLVLLIRKCNLKWRAIVHPTYNQIVSRALSISRKSWKTKVTEGSNQNPVFGDGFLCSSYLTVSKDWGYITWGMHKYQYKPLDQIDADGLWRELTQISPGLVEF